MIHFWCSSTDLSQLDISDDGFLSLMDENGDTKDDVKLPDGDLGDRITRMFRDEEKDLSTLPNWIPQQKRTRSD